MAYGPAFDEQWGLPTRAVDFFDVKGDLEALFAPRSLRFAKIEHPALHPGRSAQVELDGKVIGFIGELHPRWLQKYDLPLAPVLFEVDAEALCERVVPSYAEISKFPGATRDLALVVKQDVPVQALLDAFKAELASNELVGNSCKPLFYLMNIAAKGLERMKKVLLSALACKILNRRCRTMRSRPSWPLARSATTTRRNCVSLPPRRRGFLNPIQNGFEGRAQN
jgi:phenylalanyl-tRNA synthetase beta chain